ncbi:hypothetical protein JD844_002835 [Phrynosoma platyrhinos]|uniref:Protein TOPAZ1 n=1 Tax=Phrynosoma platyrhinos TaxID=52577 RepID=A0ABQ7TC34_PHRPL|nr:hypothetical protein JD844_002835 [Phrynosoma platyrhinos]
MWGKYLGSTWDAKLQRHFVTPTPHAEERVGRLLLVTVQRKSAFFDNIVRGKTLLLYLISLPGEFIQSKDYCERSINRTKSFSLKGRGDRKSCGKRGEVTVWYSHIVKLEVVLMKGLKSHKPGQDEKGKEPDLACRITLPNKSKRIERKKENSNSVGCHGKDMVPEKICLSGLPDHEQKTQNCMQNAEGFKEKHRCPLVKFRIRDKVKNITKKGRNSLVKVEAQNVTRSMQKTSSCSTLEPKPQEKTGNLGERTKLVWPEQKTCVNQDKGQKTKRRCLPNLECSRQSVSLWKCRERRGHIRLCKSWEQRPENCTRNLEKARSSSVSRLSSGNIMEAREDIVKSSRLRLLKSREPKIIKENSSMALTTSKLPDNVGAQKQNSQCLLKYAAHCGDSKKYQSTAEEGTCRIVTRAFLKSKMCKNDGEKLIWEPKKSVTKILGCRQVVLKKNVVVEQMVDGVSTEDLLDTRTGDSRKRQASGKDEAVISAELKKEIKTSRVYSQEVSNKQHENLAETDKDSHVQNLLEQSTCLPVSKSHETENKDCANLCFGKEVKIHCDAAASPVTNFKCLQPLDIKEVGGKVENNTLVLCQDVKPRWLAEHSDLPCSIERFPVVRLLDCCYIKALLKPGGVKSIQSNKVHFGSLHVAPSQEKVLSASRDMGQKDLSNSPNLLQAERSLPQESILVGKEMCQNCNMSSKCQNGKRFRESKWCVDFKQPNKKIKISRDLEKLAIQNIVANMNIPSECGLQMEDKLATEDCPTALGNLNYNERTCLSLLEHRPDFLLEQIHQKPQNLLTSLSCNEKMSEVHLVTCDASDFEKSLDLRKEDNVLEIKSMEPEINVDKKTNYDNSIVKMLVSGKLISSNSNGDCMKTKKAPKDKISKARKNLQLNSCQRAVPISGKNAWPRESCARTCVWVHKNHVCDLERKNLRGTDALVSSGQEESHKPLISSSKILADKIMDPKTESPAESCASEFAFHVDNTFSAVSNGSRFYSMDRRNRYRSVTKTGKKLKIGSDSLGKDVKNKSIAKRSISIDTQNVAFANGKSKTNEQKTSVTKQELLLQTLIPRNLSDFKIPLLKNKNEYEKAEYPRSSDRNTCCHMDILEDSTFSRNKRAEQTSSDLNSKYQFQSEQVNVAISRDHANQFDTDFPESHCKKSNECVETSNESKLKTSNLDNSFDSLRTEFKEKQILGSVLVPNTKDEDNNSNNLAQVRDNFNADILQAYEDDVLVIDVIQDDPDLFGDTDEQEAICTEKHVTKTNFNTGIFSEHKLKLEPESRQLPGCRYLKLCPRENPVQDYEGLKSDADLPSAEDDEIKSESPSEISSIGGVKVSSVEEGQLPVLDDKSCITNEKCKSQEKMLAVKEGKENTRNIAKMFSENTRYIEPVTHDHQLELPLPAMEATTPQWQSTAMEPWMNDFRFSRKGPLWPTSYPNRHDSWKVDKNGLINLGLLHIPHGYCRSHFNTLNGCERADCWYWHVPASGNEKIMNDSSDSHQEKGKDKSSKDKKNPKSHKDDGDKDGVLPEKYHASPTVQPPSPLIRVALALEGEIVEEEPPTSPTYLCPDIESLRSPAESSGSSYVSHRSRSPSPESDMGRPSALTQLANLTSSSPSDNISSFSDQVIHMANAINLEVIKANDEARDDVEKRVHGKFCSEVLKKYISIGEVVLLQRAVQIFTDYCKNNIPRLYLNSKILNDLLASLLQFCLLKELFLVVHTGIMINILLIDAGMVLEYEHIGCITQFLNQLQVSNQEIITFMSRFQGRHFKKACLCDFDSAVAEFQHCKEKGDWAKLGTLYINVKRGCGNVDDLQKYSLCIANILTSAMKEESPGIPFCEFAAAVNADGRHSEADKKLLGRIGISVMFSYYRKQQWSKVLYLITLSVLSPPALKVVSLLCPPTRALISESESEGKIREEVPLLMPEASTLHKDPATLGTEAEEVPLDPET